MDDQARDRHPRRAIEGVGGIEADGDLDERWNATDARPDAMPACQKRALVDERAAADRSEPLRHSCCVRTRPDDDGAGLGKAV